MRQGENFLLVLLFFKLGQRIGMSNAMFGSHFTNLTLLLVNAISDDGVENTEHYMLLCQDFNQQRTL